MDLFVCGGCEGETSLGTVFGVLAETLGCWVEELKLCSAQMTPVADLRRGRRMACFREVHLAAPYLSLKEGRR